MNINLKAPTAWDDDEKAYLKRHYGIKTNEEIAAHLHRPPNAIAGQAARLGVSKAENRTKLNPEAVHIHRAKRTMPGAGLHSITATATPYGPPPTPLTCAAPRRSMHNGSYTCPELRPYQARPGAMDAFALPSRTFDRREYRDGRVEVAA